jgi:hypothetical protein
MRRLGARQFVECSSVVDTFSHKNDRRCRNHGADSEEAIDKRRRGAPCNCLLPSALSLVNLSASVFPRDCLPRVDSEDLELEDLTERGTQKGAVGSLFPFSSFWPVVCDPLTFFAQG